MCRFPRRRQHLPHSHAFRNEVQGGIRNEGTVVQLLKSNTFFTIWVIFLATNICHTLNAWKNIKLSLLNSSNFHYFRMAHLLSESLTYWLKPICMTYIFCDLIFAFDYTGFQCRRLDSMAEWHQSSGSKSGFLQHLRNTWYLSLLVLCS